MPSLGAYRMLPIDHPERKAVGGCGGGYWWHSPEDTLDKADSNILAEDVAVYVAMTVRMCAPEVIPYNFTPSANDFIEQLSELQQVAGSHLDLSEPIALAERLKAAVSTLATSDPDDADARNQGMKRLSQILNPALFTIDGPYEFDPALQLPVLPGLAPLRQLVTLDAGSDDYQFLLTKLRRQRNRVADSLLQACELVDRLNAG